MAALQVTSWMFEQLMLKMKTIHNFRKKNLVDSEEEGSLPSLLPAVASEVGCKPD